MRFLGFKKLKQTHTKWRNQTVVQSVPTINRIQAALMRQTLDLVSGYTCLPEDMKKYPPFSAQESVLISL